MKRFAACFLLTLFVWMGSLGSRGLADSKPMLALLGNALEQTRQTLYYDSAYTKLPFPGGDVPLERGVCTDVIVRAFRAAGVDLQVEVNRDMKKNFSAYPKIWGLTGPDTNIDHRRVPNLMKFFERKGKSLPVSDKPEDYLPGDVVAWRLPNGLYHIGLVSNLPSSDPRRFLVIHNIGQGTKTEDVLFAFEQLGHYRYF
ncbi:DUF1287 domain-containing protein [Deltaproteobacteria bacterium PRO3]|nr:DUF1287 domain-containing protein [Deltaproteobacteria bacterium PRO3]